MSPSGPQRGSQSAASTEDGFRSTVFVDTDVLVYVRDSTNPHKQGRADQWITHLWRSRTGRTSYQVLSEYYLTVTEHLNPGLEPEVAREDIRDLAAWHPFSVDDLVLEGAWGLHESHRLPWWDAVVVATAQAYGCRFFLTADLAHGREFEGLEVVNPFEDKPTPFTVHDVTHRGTGSEPDR